MKVILTTNLKKVGKLGDQVTVKDGFARNYLLPKKMALRNTKDNLEHFEKIKDEIKIKEDERKQKASDLIESIKQIEINFIKEADEKDQLYGSVSKKEIINYFNEKKINIISDDIKIPEVIRSLGEHEIEINPYEGISAKLKVLVNKA